MLRAFFQPRTLFFVLAAGWLATSAPCPADDPKPVAPPGYKLIPIKEGSKTAYIQVQAVDNPYGDVHDSGGEHGPTHFSFNTTSADANKTYQFGTASTGENGAYQDKVQSTFVTKSYFADKGGHSVRDMPGLNSTVPVHSADDLARSADGFDKTFQTAGEASEQNKTSPLGSMTAAESGQTATLGGQAEAKYAYVDADKPYLGPEAASVKRDLDQMNAGLFSVKDLPDRPLTIDEVRALINHGVKPDLDQKPAEPSKPLNDPGYLPDPAPPPVRSDAPGHLLDANDLSTPGAVSHPELAVPEPAPENTEPLPH